MSSQIPASEVADAAADFATLLPDLCDIATRVPAKTATKGTSYTRTTRHSNVACRIGPQARMLLIGSGQRLSVTVEEGVTFAAGTDVAEGDALVFDTGNLLVIKVHRRGGYELTRRADVKALL